MQLLPWPAYSPIVSPIKHVWDLFGLRLPLKPRPAASQGELWLGMRTTWNSLPQAGIQNIFNSMPRHIEALIAARDGYNKY